MSTHHPLPPMAVTVLCEPTRLAPDCLQDAYHVLLLHPHLRIGAQPSAIAVPTRTEQEDVTDEDDAHRPLRAGLV